MGHLCSSILEKGQQPQGGETYEEICEEIQWEKCEEAFLDTDRKVRLVRKHVARGALLEGGILV